jgi:hypothetical protein
MIAEIRAEYWVLLQGKKHPTWPGVLVALHESGLLGIEVTVLQYPASDNGNTAVCSATVTMKGDGERDLLFTEVGDANATNTGPAIAKHIIRLAATRAKGRAGRDALALGIALVEEMGGDDEDSPRAPTSNGHRAAAPAAPEPEGRPVKHGQQCEWPECKRFLTGNQCNASQQKVQKYLCYAHLAELIQGRAKKLAEAQASAATE